MAEPGKLRVALLGNSHASAIRNAWAEMDVAALPVEITFFARPNGSGGLDSLKLRDGALVPEDPSLEAWFLKTAGVARIVLDDYDAFWIYGFGPEHKLAYAFAEELTTNTWSHSLHAACGEGFRNTVAANFRNSPLFAMCELLSAACGKPLFVSSKPLFSELHPTVGKRNIADPAGLAAIEAEAEAAGRLFDSLGARFLAQPADTVARGCFTSKDLALGDNKHMNAVFGRVMIETLLRAFAP